MDMKPRTLFNVQGLKRPRSIFRNGAFLFFIEDCEGPRFKRIEHLKYLLAADRVDGTLRWRAA